jgi:hypothetical protein
VQWASGVDLGGGQARRAALGASLASTGAFAESSHAEL